jgi:hypothetical protein
MTSPEALESETCLTWIETFFSALPMDVACFREGARIRVGRSTPFMGDAMIAATHGFTDWKLPAATSRISNTSK